MRGGKIVSEGNSWLRSNGMRQYWNRIWDAIESGEAGSEADSETEAAELPTVWLVGKSGAGKSSIIRLITGADDIEIGSGLEPCTRNTELFRFPAEKPVLQFMDTRGIGVEGYEPTEDLASHARQSSAVMVVARIDDPALEELCSVVRSIRRSRPQLPIMLVHNRASIPSGRAGLDQSRSRNQQAIESAVGRKLPAAEVGNASEPDIYRSRVEILDLLEQELPLAAFLMQREAHSSAERQEFAKVRTLVGRHSLVAGTAGALPAVGLVTTAGIQGRMLVELARHYDVRLTRDILLGLGSALGSAIVAKVGMLQLARQVGTMIPGYGQTAGIAVAGVGAFATTFAIGRASAFYMYRLKHGGELNRREIRQLYKSALKNARRSFKPGE